MKRMMRSIISSVLARLTSAKATYIFIEPLFWLFGMRSKKTACNFDKAGSILVVRLDEIGDVVLITPFLRELRRSHPTARISLIVKPSVFNLVERCPYVDEVLIYDWNTAGRFSNLHLHWRALKLAWNTLWSRRFEWAIIPRWDTDYYYATFVAYLSGAHYRVGYSEHISPDKGIMNRSYNRLLTHVIGNTSSKHEVGRNLDVLRFLGSGVERDTLELWTDPEDDAFAPQLLRTNAVESNFFLTVIAPGAGEPKRRWAIANFVELGLWLKNECKATIVMIGGTEEEHLGAAIRREIGEGAINLIGATTLRQTTALLRVSHLFIGNDSGAMHLAAACGVPVLEISCHTLNGSGSHCNSPVRFGPWTDRYAVVQPHAALAPCQDACISDQAHCINGISVEQVRGAVQRLLGMTKESRTGSFYTAPGKKI